MRVVAVAPVPNVLYASIFGSQRFSYVIQQYVATHTTAGVPSLVATGGSGGCPDNAACNEVSWITPEPSGRFVYFSASSTDTVSTIRLHALTTDPVGNGFIKSVIAGESTLRTSPQIAVIP